MRRQKSLFPIIRAAATALVVVWCGASTAMPGKETFAQGNVYYVAPSGSDGGPGTPTQPWLTIQKAANTLAAGDTVYIRAGTYPENVVPLNSGSAGNYIVYAAFPGDVVTIDGSTVALPADLYGLFEVSDKSYIRIAGLRIINAGPNVDNSGILVDRSSHIVVERNTTYHTASSGIGVWNSDNIVVDGNEVEQAGLGGYQEDITVANTDTFEVKHNEVHHGHKEGICLKDGSSYGKVYQNHVHHNGPVGIYVDAWDKPTHHIEVFQNVVHDVSESNGFSVASEAGGALQHVSFYNNIAYGNHFCGIGVSACCPDLAATHPMTDIRIINNTFYGNGLGDWGGAIYVENQDAQDVVIRNNLVSQNLTFQIALDGRVSAQNVAVDHNLIDGYRASEGEIRGSDDVEGNPLFVDGARADFHLLPNSPAIDSGSALDAPTDDYDGILRPQDGNGDSIVGFDIGAYEVPFHSEQVYLPIVLRADYG